MSTPYDLGAADVRPDGLIVSESAMTEIYMKVKEYQRDGSSWGFYNGPKKNSQKGFHRLWAKLTHKHHVHRDPRCVDALIFKPDGVILNDEPVLDGVKVRNERGNPFDTNESWKAAGLLYELCQCAVPRVTETMKCEDLRYAFYTDSDVEWLRGVVKQLHAFWSKDDGIVVFYAWGFVKEFDIYGMVQPNVSEKLKTYVDNMIVVIVTSIMRISPTLLNCLESRRDKIWHERMI
jgi:hypothetical protein